MYLSFTKIPKKGLLHIVQSDFANVKKNDVVRIFPVDDEHVKLKNSVLEYIFKPSFDLIRPLTIKESCILSYRYTKLETNLYLLGNENKIYTETYFKEPNFEYSKK